MRSDKIIQYLQYLKRMSDFTSIVGLFLFSKLLSVSQD